MIIQDTDWEGGININGELLTNTWFTDDIMIIAETTNQLQVIVNELNKQSFDFGPKINRIKNWFTHSEAEQNPMYQSLQ